GDGGAGAGPAHHHAVVGGTVHDSATHRLADRGPRPSLVDPDHLVSAPGEERQHRTGGLVVVIGAEGDPHRRSPSSSSPSTVPPGGSGSDAAQQPFLNRAGDVPTIAGQHPPGGQATRPGSGRAPTVVEEPLVSSERTVEPQRMVQA